MLYANEQRWIDTWSHEYKYRDREAVDDFIIIRVPDHFLSSPEGENQIVVGCVGRHALGKTCAIEYGLLARILFENAANSLAFASRSHIWFRSIVSLEIYSCPWSHIQMCKSSWTNFYVCLIE